MTELDFETKLKKILKKVFEIDEINLNYSMDDIPEWDSFKHILLLTKIEKEFNIKLEMNDFTEISLLIS